MLVRLQTHTEMTTYHYRLCLLLVLFSSIISVAFTDSTAGQKVPAVFVFGDSLVDVGNNNHLALSIAKANFPHNGIDFPAKKATGRFTNGYNAADLLAQKLGLPSSPAYFNVAKSTNKTNAFMGGVNFASGGAGILDGTDKLFKQAVPLSMQIQYYAGVHSELLQQIGTVEAQNYFSKSIYGMVIGSNDMLGYFGAGSDIHLKNSPQELINSMATTFAGYLKRIYNLGGRKFIVVGIGAIGCCPSQRIQNKTGGCKDETNYWSDKYNQRAKSLLQEMKAELRDLHYTYFDTYNVLLNFIQNPTNYGFVEVEAACCGLGKLNADVPCLPIAKYCSQRRDHVFWDLYHPTEAAYKIFVDTIFDGPQQYVYPINGRQLLAL